MTLRQLPRTLTLTMTLVLALTACFPENTRRLRQDQVIDIIWEAFQPSTSSQTRDNWEIKDAARVYGREVINEFSSLQVSNCPGPMPPENSPIRSSSEYWYVRVAPGQDLIATLVSADSSTPDAINPEPLFREAQFLIDPFSGDIVARKYVCDLE